LEKIYRYPEKAKEISGSGDLQIFKYVEVAMDGWMDGWNRYSNRNKKKRLVLKFIASTSERYICINMEVAGQFFFF